LCEAITMILQSSARNVLLIGLVMIVTLLFVPLVVLLAKPLSSAQHAPMITMILPLSVRAVLPVTRVTAVMNMIVVSSFAICVLILLTVQIVRKVIM